MSTTLIDDSAPLSTELTGIIQRLASHISRRGSKASRPRPIDTNRRGRTNHSNHNEVAR